MNKPVVSINRLPALDGVRGFAAMLVFFSHAGWAHQWRFLPTAGHLGVALFFTLSGFLMAYLYMPGQINARYWLAFLVRRLFRIYPLFLCIFCLGLLSHSFYPLGVFRHFNLHHVINQLLIYRLMPGFVPAYTIMVEIKFYVAFCVLALALLLFCRPHYRLGALFMLWWGFVLYTPHTGLTSLWPYFGTFLGGIVTAGVYKTRTIASHYRFDLIAAACIGIILLAIFPHNFEMLLGFKPYIYQNGWFFSPLMALLIVATLYSNWIARFFASHPARFIGYISYGIYLTNSFVYWLVNHGYINLPYVPKLLITFVVTVFFSWILHVLLEKPCIRLGKRLANALESSK